MESQVQTLLEASRVAIDSVNVRGSTVAARLRNVPARVMEVAEHGVHAGAVMAITVVTHMSGADYRQWAPIFPKPGPQRDAFEELVDDLHCPANAIARDINSEGIISNLFEEESD